MEHLKDLQITSTDHSVTVIAGVQKSIYPKGCLCAEIYGEKITIYGYGDMGVDAYRGKTANFSDTGINGEQATVENIEALIDDAFYRTAAEMGPEEVETTITDY